MPHPRTVHLIGVAGSGMQSLAMFLLESGCTVSGTDAAGAPPARLIERGLRFLSGHGPDQLPANAECVVYSAAVPAENPERLAAAAKGLTCLSYAQMVGKLTASQPAWAVAGTHGKSTVCGMLAAGLRAAGFDASHIFGAQPVALPGETCGVSGGHAGKVPPLIVEACEFQQNFLHLRPQAAVLLGVEADHFDCYPSFRELHLAFGRFVERLPQDGTLAAWADDPMAWQIAQAVQDRCRVVGFGVQSGGDWHARAIACDRGRYSFDLYCGELRWSRISLGVAGRHQVINAMAAAVLAAERGLAAEDFARGLSQFAGLRRRLEYRGEVNGVALVDDYAHHPTELDAACETVRSMFPNRPLAVVFQPHQASRTTRLLDEFALCLQNADSAYICDIYRAREGPPRPGEATSADLVARARQLGATASRFAASDLEQLALSLAANHVLLVAGAGDLGKWTDELVRRFGSDCQNE